jgi:hypothetical protein
MESVRRRVDVRVVVARRAVRREGSGGMMGGFRWCVWRDGGCACMMQESDKRVWEM